MWTPNHDRILEATTEIVKARNTKSKGKFGHVPPLPRTYSLEALQMAYQIEQSTGQVVLNPHMLQLRSLVDVDSEFLHDRNVFYEWIDWSEQNLENAGMMKVASD